MDTNSIGIIGGADGPTAIHYAVQITPMLIISIIVLVAIVALVTALITCFICRKKYRQEANA